MDKILFGIFIVLHGMVHLLYFGQSARYFELQPGMVWPDGAWVFARFFENPTIRSMANVFLILAAFGFITGGIGIFLSQPWSRSVIVGAAIFSSAIYLALWDGIVQQLDNKGGIGILINLAIIAAVLVFHWPRLDF